jgi:hypothetical protein
MLAQTRGSQLRVKFIRAVDLIGLEKAINEWLPSEGAQKAIVDRTFALTDDYWVAALWYTSSGTGERHLAAVPREG